VYVVPVGIAYERPAAGAKPSVLGRVVFALASIVRRGR
jgi:hypothetical protein